MILTETVANFIDEPDLLDKSEMIVYKNTSISSICKTSYPCCHHVILPNGKSCLMGGNEIWKIIPKKHPLYGHFKEYRFMKLKYWLNNILWHLGYWFEPRVYKPAPKQEPTNYNDTTCQPNFKIS